MINIYGIPAFSDNYIWCLFNDKNSAIIIDPGCAKTVDTYLQKNNLKLEAILITHHHPDHIGGVQKLKEKYSPKVFAYKEAAFDFTDYELSDEQMFIALNLEFKTICVPGHTLDHIAFYSDIPCIDNEGIESTQASLFCGDTLFSAGCGRLFEGSAEQMFCSLDKLSKLPTNTHIFCAHEYTLSNLAFAKTLMPTNTQLAIYTEECEKKRRMHQPTVPSVLSTELEINPFLRHNDPEIFSILKDKGLIESHNNLEVFRAIRKAKDSF